MKYLRVRFICRLTTEARFSPYKGSMLRGSLGTNLRRGLCMTRQKDCAACLLGKNCIFPRVFNPLTAPGQPVVPPFCIEPDADLKCRYLPGETFSFGLKLFSCVTDYLPFFVQAFRMAGENGMGSKSLPGRFELASVFFRDRVIFDAASGDLDIPAAGELPAPVLLPGSASGRRISLRLITPLRFKQANHFANRLEFATLCTLALRRARALWQLDGRDWQLPGDEYGRMMELARNVRIEENHLLWQDWTRYSSRQEAAMQFGGLAGEISYSGVTGAFDISPAI